MTEEVPLQSPRKRIRIIGPEDEDADVAFDEAPPAENSAVLKSSASDSNTETAKEIRAGITKFINPNNPGFSATFKQRYSDFLVNEILPSGEVLHLNDIAKPGFEKKVQNSRSASAGEPRDDEPKAQNGSAVPDTDIAQSKQSEATEQSVEDVAATEISEEDNAILITLFGEKEAQLIKKLNAQMLKNPDRKRRNFDTVLSQPMADKDQRTQAHHAIRRIFSSRLDTETGEKNVIVISANPPRSRGKQVARHAGGDRLRGKMGWDELGGPYLHFTLYKENRDTMEAVQFISNQLKIQVKNLNFAGTKDRRGITVQRVSAHRVQADRLASVGKNLRNAKIGGLKFEQMGLTLGELTGNRFVITLRDCNFPDTAGLSIDEKLAKAKQIVGNGIEGLRQDGFINYYGLQRFGTFDKGTDQTGIKLLQGKLKEAVEGILSYTPASLEAAQAEDGATQVNITSDDRSRALALHIWETTGDWRKAVDILPRKFSAEQSIIRFLGHERGGKNSQSQNWQGALESIQRGLRLMYVHAYQSLVWNTVAGHRWEKYGNKVVEGDLVIANQGRKDDQDGNGVDESGELIVRPKEEDRSYHGDDQFVRARPLSKEEAESGKYNIWDVVLPQPGFDVVYPANEVGEFYKEFMSSDKGGGLDPYNMRRKWKDISLSGGYRKLLARPSHLEYEVKRYSGELDQLVETDLDRLEKKSTGDTSGPDEIVDKGERIAVVLVMQLGSSQYATMALRELLKVGGLQTYKADFSRAS